MICNECQHMPSERTPEYGGQKRCVCKCHDAADAGPELLAACQAFVAWFDPSTAHEAKVPFLADMLPKTIDAIAKATGKPSVPMTRDEMIEETCRDRR